MENKYKDVMSHVEVTDEMRQRILRNISEEVTSRPKGRVDNRLNRSRARITTIIGIVAACGIAIAAGGFILSRAGITSSKSADIDSHSVNKTADSASYEIAMETTGGVDYMDDDVRSYGNNDLSPEFSRDTAEAVAGGVSVIYTPLIEAELVGYKGHDYTVEDRETLDEIADIINSLEIESSDVKVISDSTVLVLYSNDIVYNVALNDSYISINGAVYSYTVDFNVVDRIVSLFV